MVGRSNVGKSSLINALVKQKIARTSAAPGKTRLANYYLISSGLRARGSRPQEMYLVDLPGYGYARGGARIGRGVRAAHSGVFRSVDARGVGESRACSNSSIRVIPTCPQDAAGYAWLLAVQAPVAIVATKIDKLNRSEQARTVARAEGVVRAPLCCRSRRSKATDSMKSGSCCARGAARIRSTHAISQIRYERAGRFRKSATACGAWAGGPARMTTSRDDRSIAPSSADATSSTPRTPTAWATAKSCSATR